MDLVERTLSYLTNSRRGYDALLIPHSTPPFHAHREPTIPISSPDFPSPPSPSNASTPATLTPPYIAEGGGKFPALKWKVPTQLEGKVKEWLLICEDADGPIGFPIMHGACYGIAAQTREIGSADVEVRVKDGQGKGKGKVKENWCQGNFRYAKTLRGVPYVPPRPLKGHGAHRYFYFIIALNAPLFPDPSSSTWPARNDIVKACEGKVLGWGEWVGSAKRN